MFRLNKKKRQKQKKKSTKHINKVIDNFIKSAIEKKEEVTIIRKNIAKPFAF